MTFASLLVVSLLATVFAKVERPYLYEGVDNDNQYSGPVYRPLSYHTGENDRFKKHRLAVAVDEDGRQAENRPFYYYTDENNRLKKQGLSDVVDDDGKQRRQKKLSDNLNDDDRQRRQKKLSDNLNEEDRQRRQKKLSDDLNEDNRQIGINSYSVDYERPQKRKQRVCMLSVEKEYCVGAAESK